jgi:hypothetical protein
MASTFYFSERNGHRDGRSSNLFDNSGGAARGWTSISLEFENKDNISAKY